MGRLTQMSSAAAGSLNPTFPKGAFLNSSPCTPGLVSPVPAELNKLFSEASSSSSPVPGWFHGLSFPGFLQAHKHKQVLPLSVAAASCESIPAGCWNHTSHFLIRLSIFNQSHLPHLLCHADSCRKQLETTECSIRAIFQAKNHPQARGECTRGSRDTPKVCSFFLSLVATTALTAHSVATWLPKGPWLT